MIPDVCYAKTPEGVHIAYVIIGEGPIDLVFPGWGYSNIEYAWRIPSQRGFLGKLASIGRLIYFDPRGMGLSDKIGSSQLPTLESQMGDLLAVMDVVGSEKAALLGFDSTGPLAVLFAATYPEHTSALIVYGSEARGVWASDYPSGWTDEQYDAYLEELERRWGQLDYVREYLKWLAPTRIPDEQTLEMFTTSFRLTGGPGTAVALETMWRDTDVRPVLSAVHVPTLILHRTGDQVFPVAGGRYLAEHISGAGFVELDGDDHLPWEGDSELLVSEIDRFLRSVRDEEAELDRVLATVMFTDIVGSTERASALGDRRWKELLAAHHDVVRHLLARYRGREIDTAGDGFLATFDGPARAVRCARSTVEAVRPLGLEIRAGCHTGEVELDGDEVRGIAVHIGSRP